jgi:hypothetical protein
MFFRQPEYTLQPPHGHDEGEHVARGAPRGALRLEHDDPDDERQGADESARAGEGHLEKLGQKSRCWLNSSELFVHVLVLPTTHPL